MNGRIGLCCYANLTQPLTVNDPVEKTHHIHVNTDLNELSRIVDWFQGITQASVTPEDWMQCQIAIAEAFTNAVRHAHQGLPPQTAVEIDLHFYPNHIEMRVWDYGPPFSLMENLKAYVGKAPSESTSGRGLMLLQKIATEIEYVRVNAHQNCLLLIKRRSTASNLVRPL